MVSTLINRSQKPPLEYMVLAKLGYGYSPASLERIQALGPQEYIEEQLAPREEQDPLLQAKLAQALYPVEYDKTLPDGSAVKVKELRPYAALKAPLSQLWPLYDNTVPYAEKVFPAKQVFGATILRGVYSQWQLKELLVDFWHNHFNVSMQSDDRIAITLPVYDREVIRPHVLGNFRQMLEAVAKSACMQIYLDNASSKASPANENFARELFELHTLGSENYLNHLYNKWREVPGALQAQPEGYIDEDVYEAARAFTGWTIADGSDDWRGGKFPNTGQFLYYEQWHDHYQKRVLGVEFSPNEGPLADGLKVLDILSSHPGTARYIAKKLCIRLVADNPTPQLIDGAAAVFTRHLKADDQLAQVVRYIALSAECQQTWGQKIRRPLELVIAAFRASGADVSPNDNLLWSLLQMGQQPFAWPLPTGYPDQSNHWINAEMLLRRWNFPLNALHYNWHGFATVDAAAQTPDNLRTCKDIVQYWVKRILGHWPDPTLLNQLSVYLADGGKPDKEFGVKGNLRKERINWMVSAILLLPDFQIR